MPARRAAFLSILESSVPVAAPIASTAPVVAAIPHPTGPKEAIADLIPPLHAFCSEVIFSPYLEAPAF